MLVNLLITHYRTAWKHWCDALAFVNDATLEKRKREIACLKLENLKEKWWTLLAVDCTLLNRNKNWLRTAPFVNVQMWINEIE